jgi:hypothetical protein
LKCCLAFEFDCYIDAQKLYPSREIPLELLDKTVWFQKMEVHKGLYWYSSEPDSAVNLTAVPVARVKEILELNKKGIKPERLIIAEDSWDKAPVSNDLLENNSLTRFESKSAKGQSSHNQQKRKNKRFHDKRNN